jgi:hypothetical protein
LVVRSLIKEKPHLKKYLTRCRHCRILFFTHPRNAGRHDLGCPFGCREAYRRKKSNQRSSKYYRSKEGKIKKKYLNARRNGSRPEPGFEEKSIDPCENGHDQSTVTHLKVTISLIEGRFVTVKEIIRLIDKIVRQPSMDNRIKSFYDQGYHYQNPP